MRLSRRSLEASCGRCGPSADSGSAPKTSINSLLAIQTMAAHYRSRRCSGRHRRRCRPFVLDWRHEHGFKGTGSANQARLACVALKSLASWLAGEGILTAGDGPSVLSRIRVPRVDDETRRPLSDDELRSVLDTARHEDKRERHNCGRDHAVVVPLASTGIRFGELLGLRRCDVDWEDQQLRIRAATAKMRWSREVILHDEAVIALDNYVQDHRRGSTDPEAPLFTTQHGISFTRSGLQKLSGE